MILECIWINGYGVSGLLKQSEGHEKVLVPGDPEREMEERYSKEGIPLMETVVDDLDKLATKFNLVLPKQRF